MDPDLRIFNCQDAFQGIVADRIPTIIYRFNEAIKKECQGQENLKERVRNCCFSEGSFSFNIKELGCLQQIVNRFKQHEVCPLFIERLQVPIDHNFHRGTSMLDYISQEVFRCLFPFLTIKEVKKLSMVNSELKALINVFPREIKNLNFIGAVNSGRVVFSSLDALQQAIEPIAYSITHIDLSKLLPKTKHADLNFAALFEMEQAKRDQIMREMSEEQEKKVIKKDDKFLNFLIKDCTNLTDLNVHLHLLDSETEKNIFNVFPKLVNFKTASGSRSINRG